MNKISKRIIVATATTCLLGTVFFSHGICSNAKVTKTRQVTQITTDRISKSKIKISFPAVKKATGYQIIASTSSKFHTKKVLRIKKNRGKLTGLSNKTYYIKVRAFKKKKHKTIFYRYSPVVKVLPFTPHPKLFPTPQTSTSGAITQPPEATVAPTPVVITTPGIEPTPTVEPTHSFAQYTGSTLSAYSTKPETMVLTNYADACNYFTTYPDIKLTKNSGDKLVQEALDSSYFDQNNLIVVAVRDQLNSLEEYYLDNVAIEDVILHITIKHQINGIIPPQYATAPSRYFIYLFEVDKGITSVLETINDVIMEKK